MIHLLKSFIRFVSNSWKTSSTIADANGAKRLPVFIGMIHCRIRYHMNSQDYVKSEYWRSSVQERRVFARSCQENYRKQRDWDRLYHSNWRFISKWSSEKYSVSPRRIARRCLAYKKHYGLKHLPNVQYGVKILCEHGMQGKLEIGKDVYLLKDCFIDYTGNVTVKDQVYIAYGAVIQTHYHPYHSDWNLSNDAVQTGILIEEGAVIGTRAIIMPSCHYIGKYARVGAGAVVTHDVPDFAVVAGVPAKIIRYQEKKIH